MVRTGGSLKREFSEALAVRQQNGMEPTMKKENSMDEIFGDARATIGGRP